MERDDRRALHAVTRARQHRQAGTTAERRLLAPAAEGPRAGLSKSERRTGMKNEIDGPQGYTLGNRGARCLPASVRPGTPSVPAPANEAGRSGPPPQTLGGPSPACELKCSQPSWWIGTITAGSSTRAASTAIAAVSVKNASPHAAGTCAPPRNSTATEIGPCSEATARTTSTEALSPLRVVGHQGQRKRSSKSLRNS